MEISACPRCHGKILQDGDLLGGGEFYNQPSGTFAPKDLKAFRLSLGVAIPSTYTACLGCGLMWQSLPNEKIKEIKDYVASYKK